MFTVLYATEFDGCFAAVVAADTADAAFSAVYAEYGSLSITAGLAAWAGVYSYDDFAAAGLV